MTQGASENPAVLRRLAGSVIAYGKIAFERAPVAPPGHESAKEWGQMDVMIERCAGLEKMGVEVQVQAAA